MSFRGTEIKIFSGSSNYVFAQNIASHLGLPLGKAEIKTFNDGEVYNDSLLLAKQSPVAISFCEYGSCPKKTIFSLSIGQSKKALNIYFLFT